LEARRILDYCLLVKYLMSAAGVVAVAVLWLWMMNAASEMAAVVVVLDVLDVPAEVVVP
jgi:hypothetical protein